MSNLGIDIEEEDTVRSPRRIYDSEKIEQQSKTVTLDTTGYQDPKIGFQELCSTYHTHFAPTHAVFDLPSRARHLFLSFLVDWIVLAIMLGLLGMWWAEPPKFYFYLDDPRISYPDVEETVSATAVVLLIVVGPICVVTIAQIWVRSFRDWHQSVLASLTLFASCQMVCTFMWALVGGLRPSFLAICRPDLSLSPPIPTYPGAPEGIGRIYYSDDVCSCSHEDLIRAKHAFPSGHAASVFAMAIYLSIYISAKIKLYDNRSHLWKFAPVLFFMVISLWIGFSRIRDGRHHFRDIVVGQIIGAVIAPLVYRLHFCSLTGPDNHIPTRYTWTGRFFPFQFVDGFRKNSLPHQSPNPNGPTGPNPPIIGPNPLKNSGPSYGTAYAPNSQGVFTPPNTTTTPATISPPHYTPTISPSPPYHSPAPVPPNFSYTPTFPPSPPSHTNVDNSNV